MKKYIITGLALVFVSAIGYNVANANPSFFAGGVVSATATTSPVLMQAATATTTIVTYDTYTQGIPTKTTNAALLVQFAGTNTPALNMAFQFSQDGVDWYDDNYTQSATGYPVNSVTQSNILTWTSNNATTSRAFALPTPTRYVRVNAKMTAAPGSVWMQVVPSKERAE